MDSRKIQIGGLIFVVAMFVLVSGYSYIKSNRTVKNEEDQLSTNMVLDQNWQLRHIGQTGMAVIAPEGLKSVPIMLDEVAKQSIDSYDSYQYSKGSFALRLNVITLKETKEMQAETYAKELAKAIKRSKNVGKYKYEISPYTKEDISGSLLKGTAQKTGLEIEIDSLVLEKDSKIFETTVSFNNRNEKLQKLAEQILNSVNLSQ